MVSEKLTKSYFIFVISLGIGSFIISLISSNFAAFQWQFVLFVILSLALSSKINFQIPRVRIVLSFSDSLFFFAFLYFGGNEAILLAAVEMFFTCYLLKRNGLVFPKYTIPYNIASNTLATTLTFITWTYFGNLIDLSKNFDSIKNLVSNLGLIALAQFVYTTVLVTIFYSLANKISLHEAWKKGGLSIPVTQIAGAIMAGIAYVLITRADFLTTAIAAAVLIVGYFNYKKIIREMTTSMDAAETAQIEKAQIEKVKAEEAEQHAKELEIALIQQENISLKLQEANDALEHSAYYDPLTELPNRAYLIERLGFLLKLGIDINNKYFILFLDLRRFKDVNNRLGHTIGDKVLVLIAKRLQRIVKEEDTITRIGGDEFAIILNDLKSVQEAEKYAKKIHQKLSQPFSLQGHKVFVGVNIGISPFDSEHKNPEDILRDADIAMHHSKEKETNYAVFDKQLRNRVIDRIKLESYLRFALEKKELSMHYQPLISLQDGEIMGFEALLRWHHPKLGFISPAHFIPIAEDSGLIIPITEWILTETTSQIAKWQEISPNYKDLIVSVNISGKHIAGNGLIEAVSKALNYSKIKPNSLKLEITESTAMEDAERTVKILAGLKKLGAQLSIDDFGTGYSSLSYLHRLPFDTLKIDRSFVYSVGENGENSEVLQTIISLSKNLRMRVIAEGIETENQLRLLRNLGCDYGQGFLMSKPLPKEEMENLLYQKNLWFPQSFAEKEFGISESIPTKTDIIYPSNSSH